MAKASIKSVASTETAGILSICFESISPEIQKQVDMSMAISDTIASILSKRKLSQKEFAKMMGKTETEVSRWLAGRHNFTLATLAKISIVLHEDLVQIINYN